MKQGLNIRNAFVYKYEVCLNKDLAFYCIV